MSIKTISLRGYHNTPIGPAKQNIPIDSSIEVREEAFGIHVIGNGKHFFYPWPSVNDIEHHIEKGAKVSKMKAALKESAA